MKKVIPNKTRAVPIDDTSNFFDKSKENQEGRETFLFGIIGTNRTGKTSKAKEIIKAWREANPNGKVRAFDPQSKMRGLYDDQIILGNENWAWEAQELRDSLLVLDDYKLLNPGHLPVPGFQELLYFRAEYNIDIIYICHNPRLVINLLTFFTTHYYIFFTNSTEGGFKDKIPNFILCKTASDLVNQYVKKYGRGEYPDFPYIIVDGETQELNAYNMNN